MLIASWIEIVEYFSKIFLPFFRISAFFLIAPIWGVKVVPSKIKIVLGILLCIMISTIVDFQVMPIDLSLYMWISIGFEIIIGAFMGFSMLIVFQVFVMGGQMIAMQSGLGFASFMDPQNGINVPVVSQLYTVIITLVFLSINGHMWMLASLIDTFNIFPIGMQQLPIDGFMSLAYAGGWMFGNAILVAIPAMTALLIINMMFAIMTRSSPQLNIFTIGFPILICVGIFFLYLTVPMMVRRFIMNVEQGQSMIESWVF